jgi:uncharacterized protein
MTARRYLRWLPALAGVFVLILCFSAHLLGQTENLPPKPNRYITDQARIINPGTLDSINSQLEQFEKDTSNQIVVAIYPSLPENADIDQYTIDTYNAWGIGQKGKDNGALLLIAINNRKMFICTGRGLEGALPDAICKRIVTQLIAPAFKQGDYTGGVQAAVNAMIAATKGEYQGLGSTADERNNSDQGQQLPTWAVILIIIVFIIIITRSRGGPFIYTGGGYGGGYGGGGGWGGGGGGGFSGGGGSSAGGGAGGSW